MVGLDKLNKLTDGQQKALHENIGEFLEKHLHELKGLGHVDEAAITEYLANTDSLRKDFNVPKADLTLNNALYSIISVAPKRLLDHFTLRYQQMKNLDECMNLIHTLQGKNVIITEFSQIADVQTAIKLEDDIVYVDYNIPVTQDNWKHIQNLNELHIELDSVYYLAEAGDFYIESSNNDWNEKCFTGNIRINRLSGASFMKTDRAYYRCMIPIDSVDWISDIHTYATFIRNGWILGLVELKDGDTLLHVYPCQDNEKKYMVVECLTETTRQKMAEYVYSVTLTLGFITGTIHLGKCYEFYSTEPEYRADLAMAYHTMRPSSKTGMKIFTTNMYYVRETLKLSKVNLQDKTPLYDENDDFQAHLQNWLEPDMMQRLFTLIHNDANVARAVVTIIESSDFPLEYQASVRAIVLETLSHSVPGPKPIPDETLWEAIKTEMDKIVARYDKNVAGEPQISEESLTILRKRINSMNNPTNADSLARPLEESGYALSLNDKEALKKRNTFLHGGLVNDTEEKQSDELFYLSLMLHKLACIIILKRAGFNGYILNNPVLFNCEKAISSGEKVLIEI